jgi:hypothetical protein
MPVNFFATELAKVQERFNQTFGTMVVCNIKARQQTILAIVGMDLLERKISSTKDKGKVRDEIKKFMRTHKILNQLFNNIERSNYVEPTYKRETVENSKAV